MAAEKHPPEFPAYKHDDLTRTFQPLIRTLRVYLSSVLEQTAVSIKLEERKYGISVGVIADRKLIGTAQFVLAVTADIPGRGRPPAFRRPGQDRPGRGDPPARQLGAAGDHAAAAAGGAAADPLSRRRGLFRA